MGNAFTEIAGSSAPLVAAAPRLLATIPYTAFAANTTYIYNLAAASFSRNARQRTFSFWNAMDQPITAANMAIQDSTINVGGGLSGGVVNLGALNSGTNQVPSFTSEAYPGLASHFDAGQFSFAMGASAPTVNNLKIWVTEVF